MSELKDQLSLLGRKTEYKQDYAPVSHNRAAGFCGDPY